MSISPLKNNNGCLRADAEVGAIGRIEGEAVVIAGSPESTRLSGNQDHQIINAIVRDDECDW